jgi:hypothetical protein
MARSVSLSSVLLGCWKGESWGVKGEGGVVVLKGVCCVQLAGCWRSESGGPKLVQLKPAEETDTNKSD